MYNGIGLPTPRGSGTNGYVQRNLAYLTSYKDKINYKTEEDVKRADAVAFKEPNEEILMHEKKRQVEVKCFELEQTLEEQGYPKDEVEKHVCDLRKKLLAKLTNDVSPRCLDDVFKSKTTVDVEASRLVPKGTHETAAVTILKNNVFREALGIGDDYEVGTAMKRAQERKEEAERAKALYESQKNLKTLESSDNESNDGDKKRKKKRKSKKKEVSLKHHDKHKRKRHYSESSGTTDSEAEPKKKHRRDKHRHSDKQ